MDADFEAIQKHMALSDVPFTNALCNIQTLSQQFSVFAHEHDVNEHFRMNGYRSMIRLTDKYFSKVRAVIEKGPEAELDHYRDAAPTLVSLMRFMLHLHNQGHTDEESLEAFTRLLRFKESDVQPFHSSIRGFYLVPGLRPVMNGFVMRVILANISYSNLYHMLVDSSTKERLFSQIALNGTLDDTRCLWGPAETGVIRFVHWLKFLFAKEEMTQVTSRRPGDYVVNRDGKISSDATVTGDPITSAYLTFRPKGVSPKDSLIFHCHGGGYVSSTYKSHEVYLREWGKKLQVPIFCCSYRLSPEHPYPAALQDLLDAYLFVTSGSPESEEKLGFQPKNIIVTGDSAGGNLALALLLALNDIRKRGANVTMPVAVAIQYPNGNPSVEKSASRAMSLIDTTITLAGLGHAAGAYYGVRNTDNKSWFRSPAHEDVARELMKKMRSDSLYNPLISTDYADLKQVKLFILAAEFDPLLDDAVAIGRLWKGPLVMDLARGMPHSFMSYAAVAEVKDAIDVATARIAEGLGIGYRKN